jgi:hypothetical protein
MANTTFDVTVQGVDYEVDAPDEQTAWAWANIEHQRSPKQPIEKPKKEFSVSDIFAPIVAPLEVGVQMASGIAGQVVGGYRGIASLVSGEGLDTAAQNVRGTHEEMTYQPKAELSKGLSSAIAYPFEKGMEATKAAGGFIGEKVGGEKGRLVGESIGEQVIPVVGTVIPGMQAYKAAGASAAKSSATVAANARQSSALNQSKVSGARDALDLNIVVDPADVNPTFGNKLNRSWADEGKLDYSAAQKNMPTYNKLVREQIAGDVNFVPTAENLKALSAEVAKPYREVSAQLGKVADVNGATVNALDAIRFDRNVVGATGVAKKVNKAVDDAISKVNAGMDGGELLESISLLREDARAIYNGTHPKIENKAVAKRYQQIADTLEGHLEQGLKATNKSDLFDSYISARKKLAEIKTVEDIVNPITGEVVPYALTKGAPSRAPLEGNLKKLRNIAANFPQATAVPTKGLSSMPNSISRTSPSGTAGTAIGLTVGQPVTGGILGATVGMLGGKYQRGRMLTPEYQAANLIPENAGLFRTTP